MPPDTVKQRIAAREPLHVGFCALGTSAAELRTRCEREPMDYAFVDAQHSPYDDAALHEFCRHAASIDLGVVLRIMHPRQTWMIGHYLDLGLLGVVIPMVEEPEVVAAAIESCYYPPLGRRSWGPGRALGWAGRTAGFEYATWWNEHGLLMPQIETLAGVLRCRELVQPGVDMLVFGANDLELDLSRHPEAPFDTFDACRQYVADACADLPVKVAAGNSPLGDL